LITAFSSDSTAASLARPRNLGAAAAPYPQLRQELFIPPATTHWGWQPPVVGSGVVQQGMTAWVRGPPDRSEEQKSHSLNAEESEHAHRPSGSAQSTKKCPHRHPTLTNVSSVVGRARVTESIGEAQEKDGRKYRLQDAWQGASTSRSSTSRISTAHGLRRQ